MLCLLLHLLYTEPVRWGGAEEAATAALSVVVNSRLKFGGNIVHELQS